MTQEQFATQALSSPVWRSAFYSIIDSSICNGHGDDLYYDSIGANYTFSPVYNHVMSSNSTLFDAKKAAAMYFWYKKGDRADHSILEYFREYRHCVDDKHPFFNSNYGYYANVLGGLQTCIERLANKKTTRQACFCINNRAAMSDGSIDKLCTNAIQFFIYDDRLEMVVQMRSSNFITLLPYDAFMFSVFYAKVFKELQKTYADLRYGLVHMQVASLHLYTRNICRIKLTDSIVPPNLIDFQIGAWERKLEDYLQTQLNK